MTILLINIKFTIIYNNQIFYNYIYLVNLFTWFYLLFLLYVIESIINMLVSISILFWYYLFFIRIESHCITMPKFTVEINEYFIDSSEYIF